MKDIRTFRELEDYLNDMYDQLSTIESECLTDAEEAAMEAYDDILWYADKKTMSSLKEDKLFRQIPSLIPKKHSEYYRVFNEVIEALDRIES